MLCEVPPPRVYLRVALPGMPTQVLAEGFAVWPWAVNIQPALIYINPWGLNVR